MQSGRECFVRCFVELRGKVYVLSAIKGFERWDGMGVFVPCRVDKIGARCFFNCRSLCEVVFEFDCQLKEIEKHSFHLSHLSSIRIPKNVEIISENCFKACASLYEVRYERECRLKEIALEAFNASGLRTVRIPSSLNRIGDSCFARCDSLCEVVFEPDCQVKVIGPGAFQFCGLQAIRIPVNIRELGASCFTSCESLREVVFELNSKLKKIGANAFDKSGVKLIEIPPKCDDLSGLSLLGSPLVSISRENKSFSFENGFLMNRNKHVLIRYFGRESRVSIPKWIEIIADGCFSECEFLVGVTFDFDCKLRKIGQCAFSRCGLTSIRIPRTVEKIASCCFWNSPFLSRVLFESNPQIERLAFDACPLKSIIVSVGSKLDYQFPRNCKVSELIDVNSISWEA
jgi:hypothetical protein